MRTEGGDASPGGVAAIRASGLDEYAFAPSRDAKEPWPTLRELIGDGKRLVLFVERAEVRPAPWYRNAYVYIMETPFTFSNPDRMTCDPARGGTDKRLFLMNHWIQRAAPSRIDAGAVNDADFIVSRARRCARERQQIPNLIAVDFVNVGDVFGATDRVNNLIRARGRANPR